MRIEILESARDDLISGRAFYEKQLAGFGSYFVDSLFSDTDSLLLYAGVHPIHFDRYYRFLSKRFPFAIYYRAEGDLVRIFAVLDCRQDPARIVDRMK